MPIEVHIDDLSSLDVQSIVAEHLSGMHGNSPPGHVHALAIDGLKAHALRSGLLGRTVDCAVAAP